MRYYKVVSFKEPFDGFSDLFFTKSKKEAVSFAQRCVVPSSSIVAVDRYTLNDGWYSFDAEVFRRV